MTILILLRLTKPHAGPIGPPPFLASIRSFSGEVIEIALSKV
jgi:hypothetical protein